MLRFIDTTGALVTLWLCIRPWLYPEDVTWLAAIATAVCFWVALRTLLIYGCGGQLWPAPALMFLLLSMITNHLGAFVHFKSMWGVAIEKSASWNMIWAFNLAYLSVAAGVYICARASGRDTGQLVRRFYAKPIHFPRQQQALILPAAILLIVSLGAAIYLLGGRLPILDVLKMIAGGALSQAKMIAYATRDFLHSQVIYRGQGYVDQMRIAVMPMLIIYLMLIRQYVGKRWLNWLYWGSLTVAVVTMISGLERAPLILFIIQLLMVLMIVRQPKPNMRWLYGTLGAFTMFLTLSIIQGRGKEGATFFEHVLLKLEGAVNRIYLSNSLSSVKTFELFPDYLPHAWGASWLKDISNLLPGPGKGLTAEVYEYLWGEPGNAGIHFIAEMWANGGFMMVALVSFLFGIFAHYINLRILDLRNKTPLHLTYCGLVMFCMGLVGYGGFMTPINRGLITFSMLFGILLLFSEFSRRLNGSFASGSSDPGSGAEPVHGEGKPAQHLGITPAQGTQS